MLRHKASAISKALLFWAATMMILAICSALARRSEDATLVTGAVAVPATFALTLVVIKCGGQRAADFGFELTAGTCLRFCVGLMLGALLIAIQMAIMWLAGGIRWTPASPTPSMVLPTISYLLLASREELAFRGYPIRMLVSETNTWLAQLVIAACFVVEHKVGGASWRDALLGSGLGALVFGMAALATKGLALPIGLHAAWNIGDWMRGGKGDGGLWRISIDHGAASHVEKVAWASYAGVMVCALGALFLWQRAHIRTSK